MNNARLALQATGMVFILFGAAVLYYNTDLRNDIPEGYAIATLLVLAGLFVIVLSEQVRRGYRARTETHYVSRPARPAVERTYVRDVDTVEAEPVVDRPRRRRVRERRHIEETRRS